LRLKAIEQRLLIIRTKAIVSSILETVSKENKFAFDEAKLTLTYSFLADCPAANLFMKFGRLKWKSISSIYKKVSKIFDFANKPRQISLFLEIKEYLQEFFLIFFS
jgi:hypothetical protein